MHFLVFKDSIVVFIYLFLMARSVALGHWGISSSFRKLSTAGDYIPCSAYKDIEKAAEKVNSITSGDGGGEERGRGGGGEEERQMKFKLAVSPATNLKQYSKKQPKRKEKQRGVCMETHCARARVCVWEKEREAKQEQGKEGMRLQDEVSGAIPGGLSEQNSSQRGGFGGTVIIPSVNITTSISNQAGKA